ncbi:serine hydrolase [Flavobacteriaceae bacterium]|jgi:beta-N-acetylhexosaminidase|nr:serine hydrolase [Flavobacteriaceae bacterium]MDA7727674.1 serine hydrolase [Flavobacteriaceae bacterium]
MRHFFTLFCFIFSLSLIAQESSSPLETPDFELQTKWVDSTYNALNLKEKIGQLYMVQVFSNQDQAKKKSILKLIDTNHIGGVIYSNGGPVRQASLNNELQAASRIPLLVGMDAEWGLSMRLDSTYAFPWNMTLGAVKNLDLIRQTGVQIGEHCKRIGVNFNFAPVVDINTNPKNPIIGNRSFGEDKEEVTKRALAFMEGMQSVGVLANAKHFPGHGDTSSDSHKTLPTIDFSAERIDSLELYPYKKLISKNLSSVMVAHLNVPNLDSRPNYPSSLSYPIVTDLLKEKLGFKGLIFTDALSMKGASNFSDPGEIDLQAFLAGNDVMLMSNDVTQGIAALEKAVVSGIISEERLAHSVKKILRAKFKVGLHEFEPIETANLVADLNRQKDDLLYGELMENAITLVQNKNNNLPLKNLELHKIAYVNMGDADATPFVNSLKKYTKVEVVNATNLDALIASLSNYNTVIVGFHKSNVNPWKSYEFTDKELVWLYEIARTNNVILTLFAKPYALNDFNTFENFESILMAYQNSPIAQQKAAQIIFGALPAKGSLPVSCGIDFKVGEGLQTNSLNRLTYGLPVSVGMDARRLKKIDSIAKFAISEQMTPGIQLLVARKGKVIYEKSFGYHTYKKSSKVKFNALYDVASLTKILATLPLLMELVDSGVIGLDSTLGELLPSYKDTNKDAITIQEMLSHFAQLKPWIPFYISTLDSVTQKPNPKFYKTKSSKKFPIKINERLYLRKDFRDSIQNKIIASELLQEKKYRYSDLPYYIIKLIIEKHYDLPLDALVQQHFYKSLGANFTTYKPLEKFNKFQIIPTEIDDYFRYDTVHGYVHDMGAAMQDGVGGHAGLFSNANDVAKLMQMYLQEGVYGGKRYFSPNTFNTFNTCHYCDEENRRGIGFDKPQLEEEGPTCGCLSMTSFGHSGFTGTYAWADPEEEIVYVFLANRTYQESDTNRLSKGNIRTDIQRLIYESIIE